MGTLWEQGEKTKIPSPLTPSKIKKNWTVHEIGTVHPEPAQLAT
jgi:hypothetical protein